jgi:hypothetical protein
MREAVTIPEAGRRSETRHAQNAHLAIMAGARESRAGFADFSVSYARLDRAATLMDHIPRMNPMQVGITGASNTAHPNSWARQLARAQDGLHTVTIAAHVGWGPLHQRKLLLALPQALDLLIASPSGNGIEAGAALYMKRLGMYMDKATDRAAKIYCLTISPRRDPGLNAVAAELSKRIREKYPHFVDIYHPLAADFDKFIGTDTGNHWTSAGQTRVRELVREGTGL